MRLPAFTRAIAKPLFTSNSDDCIGDRDEYIAKSIVGAIQSRLVQYFMNVGPLFRAYPVINTPDTNRAIVNYLAGKIKNDFIGNGLFGPIAQNMDKIKLVFGKVGQYDPQFFDANEFDNEKFLYTDKPSDNELVDELIKQSYFMMVRQIANESEYNMLSGFFDSGYYENLYREAAVLLAKSMEKFGTAEQKVIMEKINKPAFAQQGDGLVSALSPEGANWVGKHALYQMPGPLLVAMQYILFDYVVKPIERYDKFRFETESRIALADDQVLSSINPSYLGTTTFSSQFQSFPITVGSDTFYYLEDLEESARKEYQECVAANQAVAAANNTLQERLDDYATRILPLAQEYGQVNENNITVLRSRALEKLNEGYPIIQDLIRDDGPAEAGISDYLSSPNLIRTLGNLFSSLFEASDAANTNGNITFIQAWWNWAKRTYASDIWSNEYFTDGNRSLGHGNLLGGTYNNIGKRNWLAQARDASARWESEETQQKIRELHDVIVATDNIHREAYQAHWGARGRYDLARETEPDIDGARQTVVEVQSAAKIE